MVTVDKRHISDLMLIEAYAEKHKAEEKLSLYQKKYNMELHELENRIKTSAKEDFDAFDDYMEWKAYRNHLAATNAKIKELRSENIQLA